MLERSDGFVEVVEPVDPERGHLAEKLRLLRFVVGELSSPFEYPREVAPSSQTLEDGAQLGQSTAVFRIDFQDGVIGLNDHRVVVQLVSIDTDDLELHGHAPLDIILLQGFHIALEEVEQGVPLAGRFVEPP